MGFADNLRDLVKVEHYAETKKMRKMMQAQQQPKGKWQRLPDGTWGYPPEAPADNGAAQAAYERGWREGWTAGWQAAQQPPPQ